MTRHKNCWAASDRFLMKSNSQSLSCLDENEVVLTLEVLLTDNDAGRVLLLPLEEPEKEEEDGAEGKNNLVTV